ncbi:MAG TPA: hypothetical protein VKA15_13525 [Isosphaeraceae bacterium]|nr:hypothetical protein [Isosphaeraceae bacterium]
MRDRSGSAGREFFEKQRTETGLAKVLIGGQSVVQAGLLQNHE